MSRSPLARPLSLSVICEDLEAEARDRLGVLLEVPRDDHLKLTLRGEPSAGGEHLTEADLRHPLTPRLEPARVTALRDELKEGRGDA